MSAFAKFRQNRPKLLVDSYHSPLHGFLRDWVLIIVPWTCRGSNRRMH